MQEPGLSDEIVFVLAAVALLARRIERGAIDSVLALSLTVSQTELESVSIRRGSARVFSATFADVTGLVVAVVFEIFCTSLCDLHAVDEVFQHRSFFLGVVLVQFHLEIQT